MKTIYSFLFLAAMFMLVGTLERQWQFPKAPQPATPSEAAAPLSHPCATWICQGGYFECQRPEKRRCVNANFAEAR